MRGSTMVPPDNQLTPIKDNDSKEPRDSSASDDPLQFIAHHLEKGASRDPYSDFLEYFNFIRDPFDPSLPLKHLKETFVVSNRQAPLFEHVGRIIENYRRFVVKSPPDNEKTSSIHGLIRAPKHAGKTTLLHVLARSLSKTRHVPRLKPAVVSLRELIADSVTQEDSRVKWQRWLAELDRELGQSDNDDRHDGMVIFIDDVEHLLSSRSPVGSLESLTWTVRDVFGVEPLVIGTISTRVFHWLLARTSRVGAQARGYDALLKSIGDSNMLRLPLLSTKDVAVLLRKRLEFCSSSVPSWVSKEALMIIAHHSVGLPGLALELLKLSLRHVKELGSRRLLPKHVQFVAKLHGFLDMSASPRDCIDWRDLSDRQKQVIFLLLHQEAKRYLSTMVGVSLDGDETNTASEGYTNKQIALQLGINLSTLTYHLKPLLHDNEKSSFLLTRRNDDDNRSKVHFLQPRAVPVVEVLIDGDLDALRDISSERIDNVLGSIPVSPSKKSKIKKREQT